MLSIFSRIGIGGGKMGGKCHKRLGMGTVHVSVSRFRDFRWISDHCMLLQIVPHCVASSTFAATRETHIFSCIIHGSTLNNGAMLF